VEIGAIVKTREPSITLGRRGGRGRVRLGAITFSARVVRAPLRAMTLVEVLVVLAIVALVMGTVVMGSGQLASSRLRHSSTMIAGAVRVAFSRATSTSKSIRLVMDLEESLIWLEEGDQPHLVQTKDTTGTGGASAATVAEQAALEESSRIVKGPTAPRTAFHEIDPMGLVASDPGKVKKPLERGIKFREVQIAHDDQPRKSGRAYLYFWPGGQTERASIQLSIGNSENDKDTITLLVSPLTGKVTVKDGVVALEPMSDQDASEREDPGAF
jgi:general secretion pathway protein H